MATRAFPEVLDGKRGDDWTVKTTPALSAMTNLVERLMLVPSGTETVAFGLRLRELARAAHSPISDMRKICTRNGVSLESLAAGEQLRLSEGLIGDRYLSPQHRAIVKAGVLTDQHCQLIRDGLAEMARTHPARAFAEGARLLVANLHTADYDRIYDILTPLFCEHDNPDEMDYMARSAIGSLVTKVDRIMRKLGPKESPSYRRFPRAIDIARLLDGFMAGSADATPTGYDPSRLDDGSSRTGRTTYAAKSRWGSMEVVTPELVEEYEIKKRLRLRRQLDYGSAVHQIDRLLVDERIFTEQRFKTAGTVLIDCSGSMSFTADSLRKLVLQCPSVTVAGYSGYDDRGELVILASKGKIAAKNVFNDFHGGNVVDGPALEWLAGMPTPRLWISDGGVTGVNDHADTGLSQEAFRIQVANRIIRLRDFERTAATLHELGKQKSE